MAASPSRPAASPSPAEMQVLVAHAGLKLNPGQIADLVLAWRQLSMLVASIPRERKLADDQAFVFRLPPPAPVREAARPAQEKEAQRGGKAKAAARKRPRAGR